MTISLFFQSRTDSIQMMIDTLNINSLNDLNQVSQVSEMPPAFSYSLLTLIGFLGFARSGSRFHRER